MGLRRASDASTRCSMQPPTPSIAISFSSARADVARGTPASESGKRAVREPVCQRPSFFQPGPCVCASGASETVPAEGARRNAISLSAARPKRSRRRRRYCERLLFLPAAKPTSSAASETERERERAGAHMPGICSGFSKNIHACSLAAAAGKHESNVLLALSLAGLRARLRAAHTSTRTQAQAQAGASDRSIRDSSSSSLPSFACHQSQQIHPLPIQPPPSRKAMHLGRSRHCCH